MESKTETQKKPWTWQEGEYTVTRGSAWSGPGCHLGCGVLLYTDKDGKLVKVEGDESNPFNEGRLCVRCLTLPEVVHHKDRLKYPMKRVGKRGEDKWERISWEEAYDTIEKKFNQIKAESGPESIIFSQGTGRDIAPYISRLAWSFGSPNWTYLLSGCACYVPRVSCLSATTGGFAVVDASQAHPDRYDNPEYEFPETLVIWGNNPVVSNSDGFFGHWVVDMMKRGTKLIVIDPRLTWLAAKADLWLQVRPGTDAALAIAMLNVIIQEGLYDKEFVDKWTYGFEQLTERATQYPVDKASEITWIPQEKIEAAARMIGKSKPVAFQWGLAVDMTKESLPAAQAIAALWEITGNVDVPGGMIFPPTLLLYAGGWGRYLKSDETEEKRIGLDRYPLYRYGFPLAQADAVVEALETGKPYPIRAAWIQTSNLLACCGMDPKRLEAGLQKCEFIVCVDLFSTPTTMALADIILPAATYPERDGLRFGDGPQRGETINKVVQVGEAKSDMQINMELGHRFNPEAWPWDNVQDMFSFMLKENAPDLQMSFQELREKAPIYPPMEYRRYEKGMLRQDGEMGFNTPTGRVELYSTVFESAGLDPLPYFEEPTESPYSTPKLFKEYPLVLTTGARHWASFHSENRQVKTLRGIKKYPEIQIHPETAAELGVHDGDWVWVENSRGRAKRIARLTPIMHQKVVCTDHAWWLPEKPGEAPNLYDMWDLNINQLIPFLPGRSGFGSNCKSLLCKVYKVMEGEN